MCLGPAGSVHSGPEIGLDAGGKDHPEALCGEPAAVEGGEKALSLSGARAGSQAEVDDLLLAIGSLTSTVTRTRPPAVTRELDEIDAQPET